MTSMRTFLNLFENLQTVAERYTSNNAYFLDYMKADKFDAYALWQTVCDFLESSGYLEEVSDVLGEEISSSEELQAHDPEVFYKLSGTIQMEIAEAVTSYEMEHNPSEVPTTSHMMLNGSKLLPRDSWLVHFSDHAPSISHEGFKFGIDQMDKLGLTKWMHDSEKSYGGYNFAFLANSRCAKNAASLHRYGRHAVIFQNSGVDAWHHADEEQQIVFHGTDVDPRDIILLINYDGDWLVKPKLRLKSGRDFLYKGDYEDCVKWVQTNFAQYRRALTGR